MDIQEVGLADFVWIDLAKDWRFWQALINAVIHFAVPYSEENFLNRGKHV
jgi:hypothetical protein